MESECLFKHVLKCNRQYALLYLMASEYSCRIRGTILGAYNRMDLVSLVTSGLHEELRDHDENLLEMTSRLDDENPDDMPAISHRRGLAPFVFVPFTEVS